jgi:uncharacterized protein (DUF488 family)
VVIIDVRDWSFYPPYYRPQNFKPFLNSKGFGYLQFKGLGNPKRFRDLEDFKIVRKKYKEFILNEKMLELLDLYNEIISKPDTLYYLVCYCATNNRNGCHRFWLKDLLLLVKKKKEEGF